MANSAIPTENMDGIRALYRSSDEEYRRIHNIRFTEDDVLRISQNVPQITHITPEANNQSNVQYDNRTFSFLVQGDYPNVQRIRNHPLVPRDIPIYGYIYDVRSGKLTEVPAATAAGRAP